MKKLLLLSMIVVICVLTLSGCSSFALKSNGALNISGNLSYDENVVRDNFAKPNDLSFASNGTSDYVIVVPSNCSENLIENVKYFKSVLIEMVNVNEMAQFNIINDDEVNDESRKIFIGNTLQSQSVTFKEITYDGYCIVIESDKIFIKGLDENGDINGIYGFLEDNLECMFARADYTYIPSLPTINLSYQNTVSIPDFEWRKVFAYEAAQNKWFNRLRTNGAIDDPEQGIEKNVGWGTWCHNVFSFVDPKLYFETNPEFYAEIDGVRVYEIDGATTQLCLSNKDIYPIIEAKMQEFIESAPENHYWDFSINDNHNYCQCEECDKVLKTTGSMMGTMLPIINRLAKKFPDKIISTLAYFYNKKPPKGISLEKNVNITLAPIISSQLYSQKYGKNNSSANAKKLLESWSELTNNVLIWDYVVDFSHLLLPFPNFDVQKDNLLFYKANNVRSIFHQASREKGDELANLRTYILSKQLWDINIDIDKTMAKYLTVTYGKADKYIAEYLDTMHKACREKAKDLEIYDSPKNHKNDYLSPKLIKEYTALIDSAIDIEKDDSVIVERLEEIKINILYAKMNESSRDYDGRRAAYYEWERLVEKHGITRFNEGDSPSLVSYFDGAFLEIIDEQIKADKFYTNLAIFLPIAVLIVLAAGGIAAMKIVKIRKSKKSGNN